MEQPQRKPLILLFMDHKDHGISNDPAMSADKNKDPAWWDPDGEGWVMPARSAFDRTRNFLDFIKENLNDLCASIQHAE